MSDSTAFRDTPEDVAPLAAVRNVRRRARGKFRPTMGPRDGISKTFATPIGGGRPVQGLYQLSRASGTQYSLGTTQTVGAGTSKPSGTLLGQCWFLDRDMSMFAAFNDAAAGGAGAFCASWHPDGSKAAFATIFAETVPSRVVSGINMVNPDTGAVVWRTLLEDMDPGGSLPGSPAPIIINAVRVYNTFTYCAASRYVYVLRTSDGAYLKRIDLDSWAWEVMDCQVRPDNRLVTPFWGQPAINGPVTTNTYEEGSYFRSAVPLYDVLSDTSVNGTPLQLRQFGVKKDNSYAYYEDHWHWRFSEHLARGPRGCIPYALAVGNSGRIYLGFTNQGFGPSTPAFVPDGTAAYTTVCAIEIDGTLAWERDTESIRTNWQATGWYNDIPVDATGAPIGAAPAGPEPSVNALCCDQAENVYAAGKVNAPSGGFNLFRLNRADGSIAWRQTLAGMIYQHCLRFDPVARLLVAVGERNNAYPGAGGQAHLWRVDPGTGAIVDHFDLNQATGAYGLDVSSTGRIVYTTGYVS